MSATESRPFPPVAGFKIKVHVGGGGFASVYKAVNSSGVIAACKVIAITRTTPASARKAIEKEVSVHGSLKHPNIVKMMAAMMVEDEDGVQYVPGAYLLLEMAHGGDLFDKIAPNVGVEDGLAHHYMAQLIASLSYIHEQGICHRDIKPENLLLSLNGELKLCDFGLCSVYKYKGQIRRLKDRCGSLPYIAPELAFEGSYDGAPIDVWGAGIILFTLLVGSTPWDEATKDAPEYVKYLDGSIWAEEPWLRIRGTARALIMGLLDPNPQKRFTLADAQQHVWFQRQSQFATQSAAELAHRLTQSLRDSGDMNILEPGPFEKNVDSGSTEEAVPMGTSSGFTQSLNFFTQLPNGMKYSPHLTRFFASLPPKKLAPLLIEALDALGVKYKVKPPATVLVGGYDVRKEKFKGRVMLEGFEWKGVECSIVEMAREEGNPISWRQFWKATVKASQLEPHLLRRR